MGGFLKWWYPQIIHINRVFHYKLHPFWGTPIFGNTHIIQVLLSLFHFPSPPKNRFKQKKWLVNLPPPKKRYPPQTPKPMGFFKGLKGRCVFFSNPFRPRNRVKLHEVERMIITKGAILNLNQPTWGDPRGQGPRVENQSHRKPILPKKKKTGPTNKKN